MRAASEVVRLCQPAQRRGLHRRRRRNARKTFWLDRARTAAISRHTNAFKLNEDVVIPLPRMGEYCDGIERINIELSHAQQAGLCDALDAFSCAAACRCIRGCRPRRGSAGRRPRGAGADAARRHVRVAGNGCSTTSTCRWRKRKSTSTASAFAPDRCATRHRVQHSSIACRTTRCALRGRKELRPQLTGIFDGVVYRPVLGRSPKPIQRRVLRSRVFVALHMHAGDGNVHTNIPVNSDDYEMLQAANAVVERIMRLAQANSAASISGEHGIGITKLEFLERREMQPFRDYKSARRSRRSFQQGQAASRRRPEQGLHAVLLAAGHRIADPGAVRHRQHRSDRSRTACAAASASRCARRTCRAPTCSTRRATRSSPPALLIEAFLYEEQTRRGVSLQAFRRVQRRRRSLHHLPQVRQPVSGGHRLRRRLDQHAQLPARAGTEEVRPGQGGGDGLPDDEGPGDDQAVRKLFMIDWGYKLQRLGYITVAKALGLIRARRGAAGDAGRAAAEGRRSSISSTSRCRADCRNGPRARCSTSRTTAISCR
jgi:hypothetical protein